MERWRSGFLPPDCHVVINPNSIIGHTSGAGFRLTTVINCSAEQDLRDTRSHMSTSSMEAPVIRRSDGDTECPWSPREAELLAVTPELQEHGYNRLTVDAVATTGPASKAPIYRRWPTKAELVLAAFVERTRQVAVDPDTGSLCGDLLQLGESIAVTSAPMRARSGRCSSRSPAVPNSTPPCRHSSSRSHPPECPKS